MLPRVALLLALMSGAAVAQPLPTWEGLGLFRVNPGADVVSNVLHVPTEGPSGDDVFLVSLAGVFRYDPLLDDESYGPWERRCHVVCAPTGGVLTAQRTLLINAPVGSVQLDRSTDAGRTWDRGVHFPGVSALFQSTIPALGGALYAGGGGYALRSLTDGTRNSWLSLGNTGGDEVAFGEIPPSPALPGGRLLVGVYNGVSYSDDAGVTFRPSSAFGQARYIATSFAFVRDAAHPYGGTAYAGAEDLAFYPGSDGSVLRSNDGGRTWATAHRFADAALYGMDEVNWVSVLATPDGSLWAGLLDTQADITPGAIVRSLDGGTTWARADAGFGGWSVNSLSLSRTGVLYAATERGVWRTTTAVVSGEASPVEASGVAVSVRPNPAGGRVEVVVSLAVAQTVRVVVLDALGREVAVVLDGTASQGETAVGVDTGSWPAGVYVVRATAGTRVASARLVVAR